MKGRNPEHRGSRTSAVCCKNECILTTVDKNARCISSKSQHDNTFCDMTKGIIMLQKSYPTHSSQPGWPVTNVDITQVIPKIITFRRVRTIAKSDCQFRHVCLSVRLSACPSVRMEQLGSHCTDSHEIWFLSIFRKSVTKIQIPIRSQKCNEYFT
jgi:hypothetical protein